MDEFTRELIAAFARVRQISHGEMLNTREIWLECLSDVARVGGHEFALIVLRRRMKQWAPTIEGLSHAEPVRRRPRATGEPARK